MNLTDDQKTLCSLLGVYGVWLLKHGKQIGQNPKSDEIKAWYAEWRKFNDNASAAILMNKIDEFCQENNYEIPKIQFEKALQDLDCVLK